jgi:hypothetical protein
VTVAAVEPATVAAAAVLTILLLLLLLLLLAHTVGRRRRLSGTGTGTGTARQQRRQRISCLSPTVRTTYSGYSGCVAGAASEQATKKEEAVRVRVRAAAAAAGINQPSLLSIEGRHNRQVSSKGRIVDVRAECWGRGESNESQASEGGPAYSQSGYYICCRVEGGGTGTKNSSQDGLRIDSRNGGEGRLMTSIRSIVTDY